MGMSNHHLMNDDHPPLFRIWICGPFRVECLAEGRYEIVPLSAWKGRRTPRLLLKALLCCQGRQAQRKALLSLLWPDLLPSYQKRELSGAVTRLRRVLSPCGYESLLITENDTQSLRLGEQPFLWVDADAATALLEEAEYAGRTTKDALPLLQKADSYLGRGPLLEGDEWPWLRTRRQSLKAAHYRCQILLAETYTQQEMFGVAQDILASLLKTDPGDEDVLRRLMDLLQQQYMYHQAITVFEEAHAHLKQSRRTFSPAMIAYAETFKRMYTWERFPIIDPEK